MIADKDRSNFFGASDTKFIMGRWTSKTFEKWWREKQGLCKNTFTSEAMIAGTNWEHRILDALGIVGLEKDKQIIDGRLRANLDGNTKWKIYEVKTHNANKTFKVSKDYRMQVQVQMYASGIHNACIVSYGLNSEDYKNFYRPIDRNRLHIHEIEYDRDFIEKYKKRLAYLSRCLDTGVFPRESRC